MSKVFWFVFQRSKEEYSMSVGGRKLSHELKSNPFREITRDVLDRHTALRRHPRKPEGTKYIRTYIAKNDRLLAHDLPGGTMQAIWVSSDNFPIDNVRDIPVELYAAGRARNSNLKAYPPLAEGECYRFKPTTADQVRRIADALVSQP
jgi:hypothetical protein